MNDCPNCEYHKQRAARWRAEAYKLGGYDGIELPWKGLTYDDLPEQYKNDSVFVTGWLWAEQKLKEKNT